MIGIQKQLVELDDGKAMSSRTVTLGIAMAAIIMLVGTGGIVVPRALQYALGLASNTNHIMAAALLLNVALIFIGWRHYKDLTLQIAEGKKAAADAKKLADRDIMTGLLNRRGLEAVAEHYIATCIARSQALAVIVADIDKFKHVNDYHGHSAGDQILAVCAQRIGKAVPSGAITARLGGDGFACFVPFDPSKREMIDQAVSAIITACSKPYERDGISVNVTLSLGITYCRPAQPSAATQYTGESLLNEATIAMHQAKRQGRDRYFWFEKHMEVEQNNRRKLEDDIRRGIKLGEFIPYYEQQIDLKSGQLTGFEMLARWNSSAYGIVNPQIFIPVAEELGLIADLSQQLISRALKDALSWDPQLTLSVNISPLQLRDPWFSQKLLKLLVENNFPPQRLEIEITESCLHENITEVRSLLSSLKNQGIRINLDDFGTGYSSLSQLRDLPFDRIKIDKSFVMGLAVDKNSASIIKAITKLGDGLGLPITAEGIETREMLAKLKAFGDFKGQGYLYGKPEPADKTLERLARLNLLKTKNEMQKTRSAPVKKHVEKKRKVAVR